MTIANIPLGWRRLLFCSLALVLGLCAVVSVLVTSGWTAQPAEAAPLSIGFPGCGTTIQQCIDNAAPGQTIVIQPSTYITNLTLSKAVSLTGVNSATVILKALANQRVLTVTGAAVNSHVIISGLTFAGGNVAGVICPAGCGGGILVEGNAQPLIEHVVITGNQAAHFGGGFFADTGSPLALVDARVVSNTAIVAGGGAYSRDSLQITGGAFQANRSDGFGGGLLSGNIIVTGTSFTDNNANFGGGLYSAGTARLTGAVFHDNLATNGGGLYVDAPIDLINSSIHNNFADQGGGAFGTDVFRIQGGVFQSNASNTDGAGLHSEGGPLVVTNTQFISNATDGMGGGIFALDDVNLTDATFRENSSLNDGGGLHTNSPLTVTNGIFQQNHVLSPTQVGGGFFAQQIVTVDGTLFVSNTAAGGAGGAYVLGGATVSRADFEYNRCTDLGCIAGGMVAATTLQMEDTQFWNNRAGSLGGGLYVQGIAVIINGRFNHNHCDDGACRGGGVFAGTGLTVVSSEFRNNAAEQGGGLWQVSGDGLIANTLFAGNSVSDTGAALYLNSAGHMRIIESTVASATAGAHAAIAVVAGTVDITDTIVASYSVGIAQTGGSVNEDYNLFFGNGSNTTGVVASGPHHPTGDPQFVNPTAGDYHLRFGSPAIDTGIDTGQVQDFEGDPRPSGLGFDIGYDEFLAKLYLPLVRR